MIRSGHRDVLGFTSDTYWNNLKEYHGLPKPAGAADALGFNLYGDEGQIFDHVEHLCLNWASENHPIAYQQSLQPLSHWTGTFKYVLEIGKQYKHHFARTASASN